MSNPTGRPEKSMSSRLMTMKFMQRAAASTPRSPQTPDSPSSKRQKLSNPSTSATASADLKAIQAALAAEEAKRSDALERQAAEVGDTKWVLSFMEDDAGRMHGRANGVAHVITTGYSDLDGSIRPQNADGEPWRPQMVGRRSFGKFNRALEKRQNGNTDLPSSSDEASIVSGKESSGDINDDSNDPFGANALIRESKEEAIQRAKAKRKAKRKAAKAEATRLAEKRKSKEVKLNKLSSISGGGGGGGSANIECYNCGQKGHVRNDCPQRSSKKRKERDTEGPRSRKSKTELDY
ncbi:hypothetical protein MMC06_006594 [Schaereria dolodes]|nr:hypothetical protein [Schaereria dolodes]